MMTDPKDLIIAHINIRGIRNKLPLLEDLLFKNKIDILCVNETLLKENMKFKVPGYNVFRKDKKTKRGGGVLILTKNNITSCKLEIESDSNKEDLLNEHISIKLENGIIITSFYKPPNNKLNYELLNTILQEKGDNIICGDFNITHKSFGGSKTTLQGKKLYRFLLNNNLTCTNDGSHTRIDDVSGKFEVLDYIFIPSNYLNKNDYSFETLDDINSDHLPISIKLSTKIIKKPDYTIKLYQKANWNDLNNYVAINYNSRCIKNVNTPQKLDYNCDILTKILQEVDHLIPTKKLKNRPRLISKNLQNLIKEKRKLRRKYYRTRSKDDKNQVNNITKQIKRELKTLINQQNLTKYKNLSDGNSLNWKAINNLREDKQRDSQIPTIKVNNQKITDTSEKLLHFKNHFENIFSGNIDPVSFNNKFKEKKELAFNKILRKSLLDHLSDPLTIDTKLVNDILKNLKKKKAPGMDKINNSVMINLTSSLSTILTTIINDSLKLSHYPKIFKKAAITLVHKSGKPKSEVKSYRPISLLSCLGKSIEKAITNLIYNWAEENNIINVDQSGFRKKRSTNDHLLKFSQSIIQNINRNKLTLAVFLDVEKAFDRVWHKGLITKLHSLKLHPSLLLWVNSFLNEREILIKIDEKFSDSFNPKYGVPQGSPLSPILFILFVSDIPKTNNISLSHFADDIGLWHAGYDLIQVEKSMQKQLTKLEIWCNNWRIGLNATKSACLLICKNSRKHHTPNLTLNNTSIPNEKSCKFLGVTFNIHADFKDHWQNIKQRIYPRLTLLIKITNSNQLMSTPCKITLFNSLIRPLIIYAPFVFLCSKTHIKNELERLLRKYLRASLNLEPGTKNELVYTLSNTTSITDKATELLKRWINSLPENHYTNLFLKNKAKSFPRHDRVKTPLFYITN